jgi:hypothetical protein
MPAASSTPASNVAKGFGPKKATAVSSALMGMFPVRRFNKTRRDVVDESFEYNSAAL